MMFVIKDMETNKYLTVDGRWEVTDKNASVMSGEAANREIDYLRRVYSISAKMEVTHKPRY
jgi:hypothetical protein